MHLDQLPGGRWLNLRRWLWKANVRRRELHKATPTSKPLTWHDLRATSASWMAVGKKAALAHQASARTQAVMTSKRLWKRFVMSETHPL
jgi:hypothetical protein